MVRSCGRKQKTNVWSMNKIWVLMCGAMIFSMQIGFAFLEAGSIRKKNAHFVFYRIMLHSLVGTLAYWLVGYAFSFGDAYNNYIGGKNYFGGNHWDQPNPTIDEVTQYANWMFQLSVAIVCVDITNGSISERTSLLATTVHCFIMVAFIYPVAVAWVWGGGWLNQKGYIDFSGSGVVHCTGAFSGLAGLLFVGPRYNRWDSFEDISDGQASRQKHSRGFDKKDIDTNQVQTFMTETGNRKKVINYTNLTKLRNKVAEDDFEVFGVTNLTYTLFGGLFLWVGFIFYNTGSTIGVLKFNGGPQELWMQAEIAAVNTFMAGCSAGLFALVVRTPLMEGWKAERKLRGEAGGICNAFLAGMVACGGGMNAYDPWAAWVVGLIGCIFYLLLCKLFDVMHVDDAVEAFQLHGGGGTAGVFCAAFFNKHNGIYYGNITSGKIFGWQLAGWITLALWSFLASSVVWWSLKKFELLRTDLKTEYVGYDYIEFVDDLDFSGKKLVKKSKANPVINTDINHSQDEVKPHQILEMHAKEVV